MLTGLLLALSLQSQLARADYAEDLLLNIKQYIGQNGGNDVLSKLDQLKGQLATLISNTDTSTASAGKTATRATTLAGNNSAGNTAATNAATTGKAAAPSVAAKQSSIQATTNSPTTRLTASTAMAEPILKSDPLNPVLDAGGNAVAVPVGGLSFDWTNCGAATDLGKKNCSEDETHLANKDPNLWKDEASKKQIAQVNLRAQEQAHKEGLTNCKYAYEHLAADVDPSNNTLAANVTAANNCSAAGVNVAGNPADALAVAMFKSKAQAKYNNYIAFNANIATHTARVDEKNNENILAQHQQRVIRLILAERAATDKSCNILDTKDLSILEPATPVTPAIINATNAVLAPLTTATLISPLTSTPGTYSNKYCSCIRLDAGGNCTEGKPVNFASKKVNTEVTALDCKLDGMGACLTTPIFVGNDSSNNPMYVNAIVKMTAEEKAAAIAAMTPLDKAAYIKKTSSIAFY